MKTKGVNYHLENDLMILKCLGSYRVTTKITKMKQNFNLINYVQPCPSQVQ